MKRTLGGREAVLAAAGFATLAAALFSPALVGRAVFYRRDIHAFFHPRIETFVRSVAEGAWPLWDPLSGFGQPLLADPTTQAAYPLTWVNLLVAPAAYYGIFALVHCVIGGLGLHFLCRRLGFGPAPSFLAGAMWLGSGPFLSLVGMAPHFAAAAWMPWVLYALDRALERPTARACAGLGAAAAVQALAGAGDMSVMTALLGLLLAGVRMGRPALPALARLARVGGAGLLWSLALAAMQLLPTFAVLGSTSRGTLAASAAGGWSLHPLSLPDLLVPGLSADIPLARGARTRLFEGREPFLQSLYLGAAAAALVALAALSSRRRLLAVGGLGFAFFLLAALGKHGPLFPHLLFPLLPFFRFPVKYLVPAALLWCVMAAAGAEALGRSWTDGERRGGRRVAIAALVLAAAALAAAGGARAAPAALEARLTPAGEAPVAGAAEGAARKLLAFAAAVGAAGALVSLRSRQAACPRWAFAGVLVLAVADLAWAGKTVNRFAPPALLTHRPPLLEKLGSDAAGHRIYVAAEPDWDRVTRGPEGWPREWSFALGVRETLYPPTAALWGLAGSFDGDVSGFAPRDRMPLAAIVHRAWATPAGVRLLQMGNVSHVVALGDEEPPALAEVAALPSVFAMPIRLLRVPDPLPRAYLVAQARREADPIAAVLDPGFDPRREVVLPEGAPALVESTPSAGRARVVDRRSDRLAMEVEASGPAYLVVTEMFDPGWRATVDGRPAPVHRANLIFRAVPVPPGRHEVRMRYLPSPVLWGAAASGLAWVVVGIMWVRTLFSGRGRGARTAGGGSSS